MKKILIVGSIGDNHIKRLISHIKEHDKTSSLLIDSFNIIPYASENNSDFNKNYYIKKHFSHCLYKIKFIRFFIYLIDLYISFYKIPGKYDLINIHYLTLTHCQLFPLFKLKSKKIMITPWGSDVYRIYSKKKLFIYRIIYKYSNFISTPPIKFRQDLISIFKFKEDKIINLGFGSEIMDLLMENTISKESAKESLNFSDYYVITCGYNRNPAQNHIQIIKELIKIKDKLPLETVLFFPMTYGPNDDGYIIQIKELLNESKFSYKIFNTYLTNNEIVNIRVATDIFIHLQNSDAYSATVQEFLYTDSWVINGNWTRYPSLEKYEIPYIIVNSIQEFSARIINDISFNHQSNLISKETKTILEDYSWNKKGLDWYYFYFNL